MIETSPYFAYSDKREIVSGVMPQTYNENILFTDYTACIGSISSRALAQRPIPSDIWFAGELIDKRGDSKNWAKLPGDQRTVGYYLKFNVDTLLAAHPEYSVKQGGTVALLFLFEGHEAGIPSIQKMEVGQRYFIRGWWDFAESEGGFFVAKHALRHS